MTETPCSLISRGRHIFLSSSASEIKRLINIIVFVLFHLLLIPLFILNFSIYRCEPGLVVLGSTMSSGWITQRCSTVTGVPICQTLKIIRKYKLV